MSQNSATGIQDPSTLTSLGAVTSTVDPAHPGKIFNYMATFSQDPSKGLTLEPDEKAKRLAAQPEPKGYKKYAALEAMIAPAPKPGQPSRVVALHQHGLDRRVTAGQRRYHALKARMPVVGAPKPQPAAPKPAIAAKPVALAPTMSMAANQLQTTNQIYVAPQRPRSLADSERRWSGSAGYIQLKFG